MISIPGGILSALIDEANSCPNDSVQQGLLFGNKTFKRTEVLSDTQEDKVVDEYQIGKDNQSVQLCPVKCFHCDAYPGLLNPPNLRRNY